MTSYTAASDVSRNETGALIAATKVKGTAVYDSAGERIGTVDDVMLEKVSGQVAYAVMSFGGFLGIGEKYHPLPWDRLEYDTDMEGYRVNDVGETYRGAPAYPRDTFYHDDGWRAETERYYRPAL